MEHKIIVGALLSLLSSASFAQMTMDDVNRNLDTYDRYVPPQSEMDQRWNDFNDIPFGTTDGQPDRHWYNHPFSNGRTYRNNYGHEIVINAWGGSRYSNGGDASNRCNIRIVVDGQLLADTRDNNHNLAKSCFASANIPKGASYSISSDPWDTWGDYRTAVKVFR
ncbi:hypothetical protein ACPV5G_19660 [Photobacterium damselae]|uniref:hypothetical protein n=1 Tax=Photobacterium damselae TaxID=38293 RepID=UPI00406907A3